MVFFFYSWGRGVSIGHLIWLCGCWEKEVAKDLFIMFCSKFVPIVLVNLSFSKLQVLLLFIRWCLLCLSHQSAGPRRALSRNMAEVCREAHKYC